MKFETVVFVSISFALCSYSIVAGERVLQLDGNRSFLTVPSSPTIQNATAFSIEMWVNPELKDWTRFQQFASKSDGASGVSERSYEISWLPSANAIAFQLFFDFKSAQPDYTSAEVRGFSGNVWTHVALTFDSTSGDLYFYTNGIEAVHQTFIDRKIRQTDLPLYFGSYGVNGGIDTDMAGSLDEIRIWTVARSGEQIRKYMRVRLTENEIGLAAYWNFNEGTVIDLSGNGLIGILNGNSSLIGVTAKDNVLAPRIVTIKRLSNGYRRLYLELATTVEHSIEASTNLISWLELTNFIATTNQSIFMDLPPTNINARFYRVLSIQ